MILQQKNLRPKNFSTNFFFHPNCFRGNDIAKKISTKKFINLPLFSTVVPAVTVTAGTTVENKGKLILTEIFPSVQKHDN